jgi:hypothetical protein
MTTITRGKMWHLIFPPTNHGILPRFLRQKHLASFSPPKDA